MTGHVDAGGAVLVTALLSFGIGCATGAWERSASVKRLRARWYRSEARYAEMKAERDTYRAQAREAVSRASEAADAACPWGVRGTVDCAEFGPRKCDGERCGEPTVRPGGGTLEERVRNLGLGEVEGAR